MKIVCLCVMHIAYYIHVPVTINSTGVVQLVPTNGRKSGVKETQNIIGQASGKCGQ